MHSRNIQMVAMALPHQLQTRTGLGMLSKLSQASQKVEAQPKNLPMWHK